MEDGKFKQREPMEMKRMRDLMRAFTQDLGFNPEDSTFGLWSLRKYTASNLKDTGDHDTANRALGHKDCGTSEKTNNAYMRDMHMMDLLAWYAGRRPTAVVPAPALIEKMLNIASRAFLALPFFPRLVLRVFETKCIFICPIRIVKLQTDKIL